jgi:hypothetical protein
MKRAEIGHNPPASNQGDPHAGKFPPRSGISCLLRAKDSSANYRKRWLLSAARIGILSTHSFEGSYEQCRSSSRSPSRTARTPAYTSSIPPAYYG